MAEYTSTGNLPVIDGKIDIKSIEALGQWESSNVNATHAEGTLIEIPMRANVADLTTAFIGTGSYEGNLGIGATNIPLASDEVDGVYAADGSNSSLMEFRAVPNDTFARNTVAGENLYTTFIQYNSGYTFHFDNGAKYIQIQTNIDPISGYPAGLNMGGNRISNCPDIGTNQYALSSGWISGGEIVNNGNGTFYISAGSGFFRSTNNDTAYLTYQIWGKSADITNPINMGELYSYIHYNGTITAATTASIKPTDVNTNIVLGEVRNINNIIYIVNSPYPSGNYAAKVNGWISDVVGSVVSSGGIVSTPTTRHIAVSSAVVWDNHFTKIITPDFDSSGTDKFEQVYRLNLTGGFTRVLNQDTFNNTEYDRDGDGTLETITPEWWANQWVILGHEFATSANPFIAVMMPRNIYVDKAGATAELPPAVLPEEFVDNGFFIGQITYQVGSDTSTIKNIKPTLISTIANAGTSIHNELAGMQGGLGNERYHITAAEHNGTGTDVMVRATSPTIITPTIASFLNSNHTHAATGATGGVIDHVNLSNKGTNTHAQIDTSIGTTLPGLVTTHAALTQTHGVSSGTIAGTGDISTHAALTTGIHGLLITAGKTITSTTGSTVEGSNTGDQTNITGNAATVTGLSVTSGKTLTATASVTVTGTDGKTLNIGTTGGTLGSAAFTASTAYDASGTTSTHAALTDSNAHGATALASANQIITRDSAGRAAVVAPSVTTDIALLSTVNDHAAVTASVHGFDSNSKLSHTTQLTNVGTNTHADIDTALNLVTRSIAIIATPFTLANNTNPQAWLPAANDTFTVAATTTYKFKGMFYITGVAIAANSTLAMGFTLNASTSITNVAYVTRNFHPAASNTVVTASTNTVWVDQVASTIISASGKVATHQVIFDGIIRINVGGSITPFIEFGTTAPGASAIVSTNSFIEFTPMGTNTMTSAGAWS